MSKAEERALEVYPYSKGKVVATGFGTIEFDQNHDERVGFVEGYNQAQQDLMEKAKQWFTDNLPSEKVQLLWSEFEQFITEN